MKKQYKSIQESFRIAAAILPFLFIMISSGIKAQCATTAQPPVSLGCIYNDQIDTFTLNAIVSPASPGCSSNAYTNSAQPNWLMTLGNTYTWASTQGGGVYAEGMGIWIDLNQDGIFSGSEYMSGSAPATTGSGSITIPFTAIPGVTKMRVRDGYYYTFSGANGSDACNTVSYGETEDYTVTLVAPTPCAGTPGSNTAAVSPTSAICPGSSAYLSLTNTYTVGNIMYQWQSSTTSSVGPWTSVPTGTAYAFLTPTLNANVWYRSVITCSSSGGGTTNSTPVLVNVAGTTTNTVPYYEGFEGITFNNQLPNCSWAASNPTTVSRTYISSQNQNRIPRTGSKFGSFYYSPSGTNYFWTNGIRLEAGVTYSASVWFTTEYYGYTTWTDMSILYGAAQSTTGLTSIVSSNGPALSPVYKSLSNTFTVATSGLYYVAIAGTSGGSCCGYNLSWDDLAIEIPCTMNTVSVAVNTPTNTICQGNAITLTASGANTYSWNTGANTASLSAAPNSNLSYVVTGTSSLTGCTGTATQNIVVNPSPVVSIFADKVNVCKGKSATLFAYGANTYNWSTLSNSTQVVVTPTATSSYTVIGTNAFGCTGTAVQTVVVLPQPNVGAAGTATNMCVGETVTLQASGAVSYAWLSGSIYIQSAQAVVSPNSTTTYTLTGTDANGCTNTANLTLNVSACTGLNANSANGNDIKVYPNPSKGEFTIELNNTSDKTIEVVDFTGRLIQSNKTNNAKVNINISNYSNGIYYVKVISNNNVNVIKVVKD